MADSIVQYFSDFTWVKAIDMAGLVLGLIYLWLEYKASIWLWLAGVIMPIVHGYLYWERGLYADFGMEIYYVFAAIYGYAAWCWHSRGRDEGQKAEKAVSRFPLRQVLPVSIVGLALWALIYWILVRFTDSSVPLCDSFTTALSMVAMWALAQKYAEQWLLWFVVDAVCFVLYLYKQIPFTAALYAFYTVIALLGYRKWLRMIPASNSSCLKSA